MANTALPAFLWQEFTTRFVTKATPINSIDSKCHNNYKEIVKQY